MGLLTPTAQGLGEEEVGVPGSWKTPAKCTLNLKLAGRAKGLERWLEGERARQARGKGKEDGGRLLVIRTFELQKS